MSSTILRAVGCTTSPTTRTIPTCVLKKGYPANSARTSRCSRGADYVFHFAGIGDIVPSIERPMEYLSTNVMGTVRVLEAARTARSEEIRLCGLVVLLRHRDGGSDDGDRADYAAVSLCAEQIHRRGGRAPLGQASTLPVDSIRIFNAYGPRSRTTGAYGAVFGVFLAQKLAGKPFTVVGDGTQTARFYVTPPIWPGRSTLPPPSARAQ